MANGDELLFELLDASQAFCHELSERLTAATNYLAAFQRLANPGYGSAPQRLDAILDKVSQQLALTGPLVNDHRQVLRAAARQRAASLVQAASPVQVGGSDDCDPRSAGLVGGLLSPEDARPVLTYRVGVLNKLARGDATAAACRRSFVVCSAPSTDSAIEIARKRFAERYGVDHWQIGASIVEIESLD